MLMTPREIRLSYERAENRKLQFKILSELNLCSVAEIKEILISQGIPESEVYGIKKRNKEEEMEKKEKKNNKEKAIENKEKKNNKEKAIENKEINRELAAVPKKEMPQVVSSALKEKRDEILNKIMEISKKMENLKEKEEELTTEYAQIQEYLAEENIVK